MSTCCSFRVRLNCQLVVFGSNKPTLQLLCHKPVSPYLFGKSRAGDFFRSSAYLTKLEFLQRRASFHRAATSCSTSALDKENEPGGGLALHNIELIHLSLLHTRTHAHAGKLTLKHALLMAYFRFKCAHLWPIFML